MQSTASLQQSGTDVQTSHFNVAASTAVNSDAVISGNHDVTGIISSNVGIASANIGIETAASGIGVKVQGVISEVTSGNNHVHVATKDHGMCSNSQDRKTALSAEVESVSTSETAISNDYVDKIFHKVAQNQVVIPITSLRNDSEQRNDSGNSSDCPTSHSQFDSLQAPLSFSVNQFGQGQLINSNGYLNSCNNREGSVEAPYRDKQYAHSNGAEMVAEAPSSEVSFVDGVCSPAPGSDISMEDRDGLSEQLRRDPKSLDSLLREDLTEEEETSMKQRSLSGPNGLLNHNMVNGGDVYGTNIKGPAEECVKWNRISDNEVLDCERLKLKGRALLDYKDEDSGIACDVPERQNSGFGQVENGSGQQRLYFKRETLGVVDLLTGSKAMNTNCSNLVVDENVNVSQTDTPTTNDFFTRHGGEASSMNIPVNTLPNMEEEMSELVNDLLCEELGLSNGTSNGIWGPSAESLQTESRLKSNTTDSFLLPPPSSLSISLAGFNVPNSATSLENAISTNFSSLPSSVVPVFNPRSFLTANSQPAPIHIPAHIQAKLSALPPSIVSFPSRIPGRLPTIVGHPINQLRQVNQLGVTSGQLGVTPGQLGVTRGQFGINPTNYGIATGQFRQMTGPGQVFGVQGPQPGALRSQVSYSTSQDQSQLMINQRLPGINHSSLLDESNGTFMSTAPLQNAGGGGSGDAQLHYLAHPGMQSLGGAGQRHMIQNVFVPQSPISNQRPQIIIQRGGSMMIQSPPHSQMHGMTPAQSLPSVQSSGSIHQTSNIVQQQLVMPMGGGVGNSNAQSLAGFRLVTASGGQQLSSGGQTLLRPRMTGGQHRQQIIIQHRSLIANQGPPPVRGTQSIVGQIMQTTHGPVLVQPGQMMHPHPAGGAFGNTVSGGSNPLQNQSFVLIRQRLPVAIDATLQQRPPFSIVTTGVPLHVSSAASSLNSALSPANHSGILPKGSASRKRKSPASCANPSTKRRKKKEGNDVGNQGGAEPECSLPSFVCEWSGCLR